jgi:superfamily II DNA or RNA helicase
MDLTYKNWQYKAISMVTKKCYNTEGVLLFHKTGTGKTLTSMGIVKNLGKNFVILCPKQIVYQWKTYYIDYYKKYLPQNYGIIPL